MQIFHSKHNANLLNTLPQSRANVNNDNSIYSEARCEVDYAPSKLFVKVTNRIYDYQLKPRLLEFYCLMSYLCYSFPDTELPILTIREKIYFFTHININKNSINTYLNDLIELGLIEREGKLYHITDISSGNISDRVIPLAKRVRCSEQGGSWSNGLYSSDSSSDTSNLTNSRRFSTPSYQEGLPLSACQDSKNIYHSPKKNFTPFYITMYKKFKTPKLGTVAVEMYLASRAYNYHHPDKVCSDLNISSKTYYTYIQELRSKSIIKRHKINYKTYHYINQYRRVLWNEYEDTMEARYDIQQEIWKQQKVLRLETRRSKAKVGEDYTDDQFNRAAKSRYWYKSPMARVMSQYNINYIQAFNNYEPEQAYLIVQELEQQYARSGGVLNASIIVRGILDAYNWTKIVDRIHNKRKREEQKEKRRQMNSRYMMDYVDFV
jgi:predicted transcriptional regulator